VAHIDRTSSGAAIKVGSKRVGLSATNNLLYVLNQVHDKGGSSTPLVVLVDAHVSFADVWNFDGVAGKAQLSNVRYFVFNPESKFMTELKWGPTQPFSANPK